MSALEGASKYLNNLLLARGLLPHGKAIAFAHPDEGADDTNATMSKIINLVHDLVLRRDREADQHESMVATIRNMRSEESQRLLDFQRMQDKSIHFKTKAVAAEAHQRAMRDDMRRLEAQVKELKEQALKMKSMMDQVRAKCVGDVKKRDTEIEKLKTHIAGLQRGKKELGGARTNAGSVKTSASTVRDWHKGSDPNNREWSLETETSDLLTALVNETTTENISLRKLVHDTIETMKDLTGLEDKSEPEEKDGIGIPGQYRKSRQKAAENAQADSLISCQTLTERLGTVIEHCRSILKDPSFVPIEEVQIREEEIAKLRAGWEKMADRWKEAVMMMGQWKQRMHDDGRSDMDEWSDLSFDRSVAVRPDGQPVLGQDDDVSAIYDQSRLSQEQDEEDIHNENESSEDTPEPSVSDAESELELEHEPARKRIASSPAKRGVKIPRPSNPLSGVDGNASRRTNPGQEMRSRTTSLGTDDAEDLENDTFHNHKLRLKTSKPPSALTVSEKLAAIEAEAVEVQTESIQGSTNKRKAGSRAKGSGKTSRRRSTLSPEELAGLMRAS